MQTRKQISEEDALCIDYYPEGRPARKSTEEQKAALLASLRGQMTTAEAHLAAGRAQVGGADQAYAVASLRKQITEAEAR